jgi:DNA-directed RNA polymerase specialized sigma24 family protein
MLKSHAVAQHVPYLRRYARALTGSQNSGDSYVAAVLEALVKEPGVIDVVENPRVALFRLFSAIWNSVAVNNTTDRIVNLRAPDRHLGQISAMPRQAFLLVSIEAFSEQDAATILNVDRQTLQNLVEESGRELAAQIASDIPIIEDEVLIALDLEHLVESLGHRSIGIARTRSEAIALSKATPRGSFWRISNWRTGARDWKPSMTCSRHSKCRSSSSRPIRNAISPANGRNRPS